MIIITHANVTLTFPVLNKYIQKKKEEEKIKYRIITALVERLTRREKQCWEWRNESLNMHAIQIFINLEKNIFFSMI